MTQTRLYCIFFSHKIVCISVSFITFKAQKHVLGDLLYMLPFDVSH